MKTMTAIFSMLGLLTTFWVGCSEPQKTQEPEAAALEQVEPIQAVAQAAEIAEPAQAQAAVPMADIEKAASVRAELDKDASDEEKEKAVLAALEAAGWTEEQYKALMYDISNDPASRSAYAQLVGAN